MSYLGRCYGTACSDNPVSCSFFTGKDIKSDGFSIETCKIMVDLLDVSFKAVPRWYSSACAEVGELPLQWWVHTDVLMTPEVKLILPWLPWIKMVALAITAGPWHMPSPRQQGKSIIRQDDLIWSLPSVCVFWFSWGQSDVRAGKRHLALSMVWIALAAEFEHAHLGVLHCSVIWLELVRAW